MVVQYGNNATLAWNGNTNGRLHQDWKITSRVQKTFVDFLTYVLVDTFSNFSIANETDSATLVGNESAIMNSTFDFFAIGADGSNYNNVTGAINPKVSYNIQNR